MILQIRSFGIGDHERLVCLLDLDERGEVLHSWGPMAEHFVSRVDRLKEMRPNLDYSIEIVVHWLARDNLYHTYRLFDERWEAMVDAADTARFFEGNSDKAITDEEQVKHLLAKPERHWKKGYSAYELAHAWLKADDIPVRVWNVLEKCPAFSGARLIRAFFEQKTELRTAGRPSQTDLLVELKVNDDLAVVGVEGKVNEPFGELVSVWLTEASDGKEARLARLCADLDLSADSVDTLRYQLLHRTAATLYEAEERKAPTALMLVHSFSADDASFEDFQRFTEAMGALVASVGTIAGPIRRLNRDLYFGWVRDRPAE